jgi:hypothetical protein
MSIWTITTNDRSHLDLRLEASLSIFVSWTRAFQGPWDERTGLVEPFF